MMSGTDNTSDNMHQHRTTIRNTAPGTLLSHVCMFTVVLLCAAAIVCGTAGAEQSYVDENANMYKQLTSQSTSGNPGDIDWIEKTSMPIPASAFGYAVVNGNIYIIGGDASGTAVQRYNPATDTWEKDTNNGGTLSPLPQPRAVLYCGVISGKIHAIGGWDENQAYKSDHFIYDPLSNTWSTGPSIPQYPIGQFAATVNNKIYVFGGWWGSYNDLVFEYSDETGWTSKSPMPTARNHGTTAVYDGKIYVMGGQASYQPTDVVEIYDPETDTWTAGLTPMPTPQHWLGSSGSPVSKGIIYVLGPGDTVYAYNPQSDSWDTLNSMPDPAYGIAEINGLIYAIGPEHTFQGVCSPWSMFHHDAQHTGRSPYKGAQTGDLKWTFETTAQTYNSGVIGSDGTIYISNFDGDPALYALNPNGSLKWSVSAGGPGRTPAIGSDNTIYLGSYDGTFYALNPDGTVKWHLDLADGLGGPPTIGHDGTIYIGSMEGKLYAINSDGSLRWTYMANDDIWGCPAIDLDGTIYVGSRDDYFHAINHDGTLKWKYLTGGDVDSSPAIGSDGSIYAGSNDGKLYAFHPDGTVKWTYSTGGPMYYSSPGIGTDGTIYVGSFDNSFYAVNADGTLKWKYTTEGGIVSSPAIGSDGTIYIGSEDANVYAINPDGTLKWKYTTISPLSDASPIIGKDGTIYIGSGWGCAVYAIGGTSVPEVSATPQTQEVSTGGIATVNLTLNEASDGLSGYNLTVSLSNASVAEILSVSFPLWASLNDNSTFPADSVWIKGVDLGDQVGVGATDINLGTLTLRGDSKGTSDIVITVTKMDADDGYPINPDTTSGTIEVTDVIPLPGYTDPPTDPDQDGLYEDLNGNGMIDFDDVVLYFEYLEWIEANEPNACFDFNGNGWIDFDDLVKLFEEV